MAMIQRPDGDVWTGDEWINPSVVIGARDAYTWTCLADAADELAAHADEPEFYGAEIVPLCECGQPATTSRPRGWNPATNSPVSEWVCQACAAAEAGDDVYCAGCGAPGIELCRQCAPRPEDEGQRRARLAAENGPEWCSECETFTGHLLAGNLCGNCRNAALREAQ